jgi:hypothetical protein
MLYELYISIHDLYDAGTVCCAFMRATLKFLGRYHIFNAYNKSQETSFVQVLDYHLRSQILKETDVFNKL